MVLKLDMSKAYDRVEWNFLSEMLKQMGFVDQSIRLFMTCVRSARYQICHAGRNFGSIVPKRGIRQGDPFSFYLFLICMEGRSVLIKEYEKRKLVSGIQVARGAPRLTHMFFADDTYIYCKAKENEADHVIDLLQIFERSSGQKINKEKSSIFFSRNTDQGVKEVICSMLQFKEADANTTYLGLPNTIGRNKSMVLGFLKEIMQERVQGWDKNCLSRGGKELMLKSVAQALPNYAMSMFFLPQQLCVDLERIMYKYWWKGSNGNKGVHWMQWDRMCTKKSEGGIGFRNSRTST